MWQPTLRFLDDFFVKRPQGFRLLHRCAAEGKHLLGLVVYRNGSGGCLGQGLVLAGGRLAQAPHLLQGIPGGFQGGFVYGVQGHVVGGVALGKLAIGALHDAGGDILVPVVGLVVDDLVHLAVNAVALFLGEAAGDGVVVIVIEEVAKQDGRADGEQGHQGEDVFFIKLQAVLIRGAVIGQLHPVGHRDHHRQEEGQQEGLDWEHAQVLDGGGNDHGNIGLAQQHLIVPAHDSAVEDDVHKQIHGEPGQHHPGGGDLRPVEEHGEEHGAGHLHEHAGEEVSALGEQQAAQGIGDAGGQAGHHRPEDHGAQRVNKGRGNVDVQVRSDGDVQTLQGHPKGDHQGRDYQHPGILQLRGGVTPIFLAEGRGVQGSGFVSFGHKYSLL